MSTSNYIPRLKKEYKETISKKLQDKYGFKSNMRVPKLKKIVLNQGLGAAVADKKIIEQSIKELSSITGQKAVPTYSRKDISNFKLRKGVAIGAKVTLRGTLMYEFLDRLVSVALPGTRDFRGIKRNGFDGRGNYSFGIKEQIIFPEIDIDKVNRIQGMDVTFVTSTDSDQEAFELLTEFGLPFKKN